MVLWIFLPPRREKGVLGSGSVCNYPIAGQVAALHNKTGARQMTPRVKAGKWSTINGDKQEKLAIRISSKTDIKLHREGLQDIKKAFCGLCHNNCTRNRANWPFFHPIDQLPRRIAREV